MNTQRQGSRVLPSLVSFGKAGEGRGRPGSAGVSPASFEARLARRASPAGRRRSQGFTMIEIALCLAIIGFALVAIIAALPRGLDVEKKNREETIISQDAPKWMDEIRNGEQGDDDLTNYVIIITNLWTTFDGPIPPLQTGLTTVHSTGIDWYSTTNSSEPPFALTNGASIIGILSTPKWTAPMFGRIGNYQSNYIIAYVRAISGAEVNKPPQANPTILSDAFIYRMIVENFPYVPVDTNAFCMNCQLISPNATGTNLVSDAGWIDRTNLAYIEWMLQTNLHDLRLRFRYPVLPNGEIPSYGLTTFRDMAGGQINSNAMNGQPLYFVQPSFYTQLVTNGTRQIPQ